MKERLVSYRFYFLEVRDRIVAIFHLQFKKREEVAFCFSQVSLSYYLHQYVGFEHAFSEGLIEALLEGAEDAKLPDFDYLDEVVFDHFISTRLAKALVAVAEVINCGEWMIKYVENRFVQIKAKNIKRYWIPKVVTADLAEQGSMLAAYYLTTKPFQVEIFFSKLQGAEYIPKHPGRLITAHIAQSVLPDDCLEQTEVIDDLPAEVFAYLLWIQRPDIFESQSHAPRSVGVEVV